MKIRYLGHSAVLLNIGKHEIIIDPFLTGNPDSPVSPEEIKADFIALTHGHGDHFGDTLQIAKKNNATVIAIAELAKHSASLGAKVHAMNIGGSHVFPFGKLKLTIAHHSSSTPDGKYLGDAAGIIISSNGQTIYHAGDTALTNDIKLIGLQFKIDVMFVPIGDNFTMGINDAVKAVEFVQPKLAVPIHYNTFPEIECDPQEFADKVAAVGLNAKIMKYGETIEI